MSDKANQQTTLSCWGPGSFVKNHCESHQSTRMGFEPTRAEHNGLAALPDKGSSDNILEMSSNVELHSQSRRSSMTFGPIASKCFNISSQSKRAILKIFLTFVTFDQPDCRGMSTARFRVSPLGGWVRCQSNCRTAPKLYERVILSSGRVRGQKSSGLKFITNDDERLWRGV